MKKTDSLPRYTISEETKKAKQIKELSQDRAYLVLEQTRLKNQLHAILHRIWNSAYRDKFKNPFSMKAMQYWARARPNCDPFLLRTMKRKTKRLIDLNYEITELEKEMKIILEEGGYTIQTANGCGIVLAGAMVAEIGDISRFRSPGSLAKYSGCAPREYSSGKTHRHRKTRAGNRQLNRAFHLMALSQISRSGNAKARAYFQEKISQGKSKSQALVCLRRHLVTIIWCMMKHREVYRSA